MFYVYIEDFVTTYEPAEGGYYVEVSKVDLWGTFDNVAAAKAAVACEYGDYDDVVFEEDHARYDYSIGTFDSDGNADTAEAPAEFICEVDRNAHYYQGSGLRLICVAEGQPEPYPVVYVGYR